jgi:hypothetical protein
MNPDKSLPKRIQEIEKALRRIHGELKDLNFRLDYLIDLLRHIR